MVLSIIIYQPVGKGHLWSQITKRNIPGNSPLAHEFLVGGNKPPPRKKCSSLWIINLLEMFEQQDGTIGHFETLDQP
jgi:hypothetical protein